MGKIINVLKNLLVQLFEFFKNPNYFALMAIFSSIFFFLFFYVFWVPIFFIWGDVELFFSFFESYGAISTTIENSFFLTLYNPTIQNIAIVVTVGIAAIYALTKIRDQGYKVVETDGPAGQYFSTLVLILTIVVFFLLPYFVYLGLKQKYFELGIVVSVMLFNNFIGYPLLNSYSKIIFDYNRISRLKTELKNAKVYESSETFLKYFGLAYRNQIAIVMICLIVFGLFFSFVMNFNLISSIYVEISLFVNFFIFCSITRIPEGPVNIFLRDSNKIFYNVYLSEESSKGHMFITIKNDTSPKKIQTSSILFIEPTLEDNDELINEHILPNEISVKIFFDDEN